jgi:hypothetical protein
MIIKGTSNIGTSPSSSGGGGAVLKEHHLTIEYSTGGGNMKFTCTIYHEKTTALTFSDIHSYLYNKGLNSTTKCLNATGKWYNSNQALHYLIYGIFYYGSDTIGQCLAPITSGNYGDYSIGSSATITDTIV